MPHGRLAARQAPAQRSDAVVHGSAAVAESIGNRESCSSPGTSAIVIPMAYSSAPGQAGPRARDRRAGERSRDPVADPPGATRTVGLLVWIGLLLFESTGSGESMVMARKHAAVAAGIALYCAGLLATLTHSTGHVSVPLRLAGLVLLRWSAWRQRSLTVWIFWAMIAGGELGADAPAFAISLRVFSDIFLRLIKTIVAPLILGTLITGIAAHGQMRSLGRMGLKALVYFEVLTTIAMLVGLAAINITHAGVGLAFPQQHAAATFPPAQAARYALG